MTFDDRSAMSVEEMLWRLEGALRRGELDDFERGVVLGCLRGAKRVKGWTPSPKQEQILRGAIAELQEPDFEVIDEASDEVAQLKLDLD